MRGALRYILSHTQTYPYATLINLTLAIGLIGYGAPAFAAGRKARGLTFDFVKLPLHCTITNHTHRYWTGRVSRTSSGSGAGGSSSDSRKFWYDACKDGQTLTFTDAEGNVYREAEIVSWRQETAETIEQSFLRESFMGGMMNSEPDDPLGDRCTPPADCTGPTCTAALYMWDGPLCNGTVDGDFVWMKQDSGANLHPHATANCGAPSPGDIGDAVPCWRPSTPCTSHAGGSCPEHYNCGDEKCFKIIDPALEKELHMSVSEEQYILGICTLVFGCLFVLTGISAARTTHGGDREKWRRICPGICGKEEQPSSM